MKNFCLLPKELVFLVLESLEYEDKIELLCCRLEWYDLWLKRVFRKLHVRKWRKNSWIEIEKLIENPYDQLCLEFTNKIVVEDILPLLGHSYQFLHLSCSESQFSEFISLKNRIRVKRLRISLEGGHDGKSSNDFPYCFGQIFDCEAVSLLWRDRNQVVTLPHLPAVTSLSLDHANLNVSIPQMLELYSKTLHCLSLYDCTISDVSMLGSIPHLELMYCEDLVDISALNDNDHIVVSACKHIQDYSSSFMNSRTIRVFMDTSTTETLFFDISQMRKVEDLTLEIGANVCYLFNDNQLPKTVKRCSLGGSIVAAVDFTVTANHQLQELQLSNDESIYRLEAYGFERLVQIDLANMKTLTSLGGLGRGRNRKVSLYQCDKITDFSPLNTLPIVRIGSCLGFTDLSQIRSVKHINIRFHTSAKVRAPELPLSDNPFGSIQSLTISAISQVKCLNGLTKIPKLQLCYGDFVWILRFLEDGGSFENQRIVLMNCSSSAIAFDEILELHDRFMTDRYDSYNKLPKDWIWVRKK